MMSITSSNPKEFSLFENLPSDLIRLLIVETQCPMVFSVCKLFNTYSKDEYFWKNFAKLVSANEFPPRHFTQDLRLAANIPVSWQAYCRQRLEYDREVKSFSHATSRRLIKEFQRFRTEQDLGFVAGPIDPNNLYHWSGYLPGGENTPYAGGAFYFDLKIPIDYPLNPPKVVFITKMYHPNIDSEGRHCLNIFYDKWSPALIIRASLLSLKLMFDFPNPYEPMNIEAANMYKQNYGQYVKLARECTLKHAMKKIN